MKIKFRFVNQQKLSLVIEDVGQKDDQFEHAVALALEEFILRLPCIPGFRDEFAIDHFEPNRSILRSYLAKALSVAREESQASTELGLAKDLDRDDVSRAEPVVGNSAFLRLRTHRRTRQGEARKHYYGNDRT